jgi:hypothetical protein
MDEPLPSGTGERVRGGGAGQHFLEPGVLTPPPGAGWRAIVPCGEDVHEVAGAVERRAKVVTSRGAG